MPNWCSNNFTVYHEDPEMLKKFTQAVNDCNLFQTFIPMPEALSDTTASPYRDSDVSLIEKYGHDNWYSWCVSNWGTKWDISSSSAFEEGNLVKGSFLTAWSPPIEAYDKLSKMGFDIEVIYDEEGGSFIGKYVSEYGDTYYEFPDFEDENWRDSFNDDPDILQLLESHYDSWLEYKEWEEQENK